MVELDNPQSRGRRFSWFIMAGCAAFCLVEVLLYLAPHFVDRSQSLDLAGPWRTCFAASPQARCDQGTVVHLPAGLRGGGPETPYLILERQAPPSGAFAANPHSLIAGTVSSSLRVYFGSTLAAEFGDFQKPRYMQTLPMLAGLGPTPELKSMRLVVAAKNPGVHGVLRGPFLLTPARTGMVLSAAIFSEIVLIPLLSAVVLLGIIAWILMSWDSSTLHRPGPIRSFLVFCGIAFLYSLSLTRIPREFLPETLGTVVHFILRLVMEVAHVRMIRRTLSVRAKVTLIWEKFLVGAALFCTVAVLFDPVHLTPAVGLVFRSLSFLFLITIFTGLAASWRAQGPRRTLAPLYILLVPMQTWDSFALNGWAPDVYCVRFYLGVIGGFYLLVFWTLLSGQRRRETHSLMIGQRTARIVHDLRGPLGAVRAGFNAILGGQRVEQSTALVQEALRRMDSYLKSVLTGTPESFGRETCSVEGLISRLRREHPSWADESRGRRLVFRVQGSALRPDSVVFASSDRLSRCLWNLVDNAFKAGEQVQDITENRVTVTLETSVNRLDITLTDSGPGFDPETAWMIENWFGASAKAPSGYGLSFCQEVIAQAGGHMSVQNSFGGVVLLSLPVKSSEEQDFPLPIVPPLEAAPEVSNELH